MITLTNAGAAHASSATHPAGARSTPAVPADGANVLPDFAGLLGTGIGCGLPAEPAPELLETKKEPVPDAGSNAAGQDLGALLDTVAASRANADAQLPGAAPIALQPVAASLGAIVAAAEQPRASDSAALQVSNGNSPGRVGMATELAPGTIQADAKRSNAGRHMADGDNRNHTEPAPTSAPKSAAEATPAGTPGFATAPDLKPQPWAPAPQPALQLPSAGSLLPGHALAPTQPAHMQAPATHVEQLTQTIGSAAWSEGLSSRVVWMARNDVQSAQISINPPDLGPIEVRLVLTGDQGAQGTASVQFSAAHASTREAIEAGLPRLREMLLDSGIALGNTSVDARTAGNSGGSNDSGRPSAGGPQRESRTDRTAEPPIQPHPNHALVGGNGLVDIFA